jgi:hypothetical protein
MSAETELLAKMQDRIGLLEKQLADLQYRFELENPNIPWHVLAVAVAAVVPNGRITGVIPGEKFADILTQNLWSVGGRLDLFSSHRIR